MTDSHEFGPGKAIVADELGRERQSIFATRPADGTGAAKVPDYAADEMVVRRAECLDDLVRIVSAKSPQILANKILALCAMHYGASMRTTLSLRKERLARLAEIFAGVDEAWSIIAASRVDDPGMFFSPVIKTMVKSAGPVIKARDELWAELARLGPPSKGDGQNPSQPMLRFLLTAEVLWMEETSAPVKKHSARYREWLSLLFYVATGETDKSFDKALRNFAKWEREQRADPA